MGIPRVKEPVHLEMETGYISLCKKEVRKIIRLKSAACRTGRGNVGDMLVPWKGIKSCSVAVSGCIISYGPCMQLPPVHWPCPTHSWLFVAFADGKNIP